MEMEDRFNYNLTGVRGLATAYEILRSQAGSGRPSVAETDVLRAAVVMLHATMEDLMRSVSAWKLPSAAPAAFKNIPFPTPNAETKLSLEQLHGFRGQTVNELFVQAIEQLLEKSTYNNAHDVGSALARIGIEPKPILDKFATTIDAITSRRHLIVHRMDANPSAGSGHHKAHSLAVTTVKKWVTVMETLGSEILAEVRVLP
jgi:hypothetical protein